jgi:hypothetical protein
VHWSDTDAAGVTWFPNFLRMFEDAEEELFASLGQARQSLLERHEAAMPRVEGNGAVRSPTAQAGQLKVRIGIETTVENPRRLHRSSRFATMPRTCCWLRGIVRAACVTLLNLTTRPALEWCRFCRGCPTLPSVQGRGEVELPWT